VSFLAKATVKEIHINFPQKKHLQHFIEVLSSALKYVEFTLTYKQGVLRIRIAGERDSVIESVNIAKSTGKMFVASMTPNKDGFYNHHLHLIQRISTKIISIDSISSVLNYSGSESFVSGQELITKSTMQEVQIILSDLFNIIQEFPRTIRTQIMKKVLLTVSYVTDYPPEFVIDKGLELDYFKYQNESIIVNEAPDKCIEDLIEKLSKNTTKDEFNQYIKEQNSSNRIYIRD
jgi:hypothetical protein